MVCAVDDKVKFGNDIILDVNKCVKKQCQPEIVNSINNMKKTSKHLRNEHQTFKLVTSNRVSEYTERIILMSIVDMQSNVPNKWDNKRRLLYIYKNTSVAEFNVAKRMTSCIRDIGNISMQVLSQSGLEFKMGANIILYFLFQTCAAKSRAHIVDFKKSGRNTQNCFS